MLGRRQTLSVIAAIAGCAAGGAAIGFGLAGTTPESVDSATQAAPAADTAGVDAVAPSWPRGSRTEAEQMIGALGTPRGVKDGLPASFASAAPVADFGLRLSESRLAFSGSGRSVFITPGTAGAFCVTVVGSSAGAPITSCSTSALLRKAPAWVGTVSDDGAREVYGVVPDGFTHVTVGASRAPVENNVFMVLDADGSVAVAHGSDGRELSSQVGPTP